MVFLYFFFNDQATTEIYTYCHTLSLHDALPSSRARRHLPTRLATNEVGNLLEHVIAIAEQRGERVDRHVVRELRVDQRLDRTAGFLDSLGKLAGIVDRDDVVVLAVHEE